MTLPFPPHTRPLGKSGIEISSLAWGMWRFAGLELSAARAAIDAALGNAWLGRVRNKRLAATIARFVDHVQTVRLSTLSNAQTRQVVLDGLIRLHQALVRRDEAGARACMAEFMQEAEHAYFTIRKAELGEA